MTLDQIKHFVADLARPFSIVATSASAAVVPVIVAVRAEPDQLDLAAAGVFVGAIYAGVAGLYWGKSWEQARAKQAEVEKAKVASSPPAASASDDGDLPQGERVNP